MMAVYLPWILLHSHKLLELAINISRSCVKKTNATFCSLARERCIYYTAKSVMQKRDKKLGADFQEAATGSSDEKAAKINTSV